MPDRVIAQDAAPVYVPPPEGDFRAVAVDLIDLGVVVSPKWGPKHKVAIVFQIDCPDGDGKPYLMAERFTNSMNEKSALRKFLGQWRGRPYSEREAKAGVALDSLVGQQAVVTVAHNQVDDKVYANVFAIRRLGKDDVPMTAAPYERSPRWAEKRAEANGAPRPMLPNRTPVAPRQQTPVNAGPGLMPDVPMPTDADLAVDDGSDLPF